MLNRIVAHFSDGKIVKGTTADFFPNKVAFHLTMKDNGNNEAVSIKDMKALFFVKTYEGNPGYRDKTDVQRNGLGKRIKVAFNDGETLVGYTQGYTPGRPGFMVFPADPDSNNDKVFINTASTKKVQFM